MAWRGRLKIALGVEDLRGCGARFALPRLNLQPKIASLAGAESRNSFCWARSSTMPVNCVRVCSSSRRRQ